MLIRPDLDIRQNKQASEASLLNKGSSLASTLGVTKNIRNITLNLVALQSYLSQTYVQLSTYWEWFVDDLSQTLAAQQNGTSFIGSITSN